MPALCGVSDAEDTLCPKEITEADRSASWAATFSYTYEGDMERGKR